jgi:hypothetical protein
VRWFRFAPMDNRTRVFLCEMRAKLNLEIEEFQTRMIPIHMNILHQAELEYADLMYSLTGLKIGDKATVDTYDKDVVVLLSIQFVNTGAVFNGMPLQISDANIAAEFEDGRKGAVEIQGIQLIGLTKVE